MGKVHTNLKVNGDFIYNNNPINGYILTTDAHGLVSWTQSSVFESTDYASLPATGLSSRLYITKNNNNVYRWDGSTYQQINNITTNIIYTDLVNKKMSGELITGMSYKITDFQTIYDQPDFNYDGTPKTNPVVKTGPIEPIIVTAISPNELGVDAFQEDHPNDTIKYILEFTTPITGTVTKGRIIKRIDDRGNESDFDHRNVLFKRYKDRNDSYSEFRDSIGGLVYDGFTKVQTIRPEIQLRSNTYGVSFNSSIGGATPGIYTSVSQSGPASISGATGSQFKVTVSPSGNVIDVDISFAGEGYVLNDVIDLDVSGLGGYGTLSVTATSFIEIQVDVDSTSNMTTSGNGQGAGLRIYYSPSSVSVQVLQTGSGYAIGDTITIPASVFSDIPGTPATDLILTVTEVIIDSIESLAIDVTEDSGNYLGDTYSNYLNIEITGYQPAFDLPNITIGLDNYVNNNRFYGYLRNVSIVGRCKNNTFSGGVIDFISRFGAIEDTIISGKILNVRFGGDIVRSNLGKISNIRINSGYIINSTINEFHEFNMHELFINDSTINEFKYNAVDPKLDYRGAYSIFDLARLTIYNCQFTAFINNTFHGRDSYIGRSKVNYFSSNILGDGKGAGASIYDITFAEIDGCTFNDAQFGNNRGGRMTGCTFHGHAKWNDFGPEAYDSIFGYGFGYPDEIDEYESISHNRIPQNGGNIFKASIVGCVFGRYSTGNIFNSPVQGFVFRDHLTNNCFDNLIIPDVPICVELTSRSELYERQKTSVFVHRKSHEYTYSIGDTYMLGNFPPNYPLGIKPYWYRSEVGTNMTTNLFFIVNEWYFSYKWQNEPALLGTQGGLNTSRLNTSLISEDLTPQELTVKGDLKDFIRILGGHSNGITIYIPSIDELQEIYNNYLAAGPTDYLDGVGYLPVYQVGKVWSSTENDANTAYALDFSTGITSVEHKTSGFAVIPIAVKTYDYVLKLEYVDEYGSTTIVDLN